MAAKRTEQLRQLMKMQKATVTKNKINHPLAKYNNLEQLVCVVCSSVVKNDNMWKFHLQSRKHKENVIKIKSKSTEASSVKTNLRVENSVASQRGGQSETQKKTSVAEEASTLTTSANSLPPGFFDNDVKKMETEETKIEPTKLNLKRKLSEEESKIKAIEIEENAEKKVPEGFFDDPKKDAKARNVEYVNPEEEEWERFQQMVAEESKVSEQIQDAEDEQAEMLKDMQEYNNMKNCLSRVDKLKTQMRNKGAAKHENNAPVEDSDAGSEDEDEDLAQLYDWRAKTV